MVSKGRKNVVLHGFETKDENGLVEIPLRAKKHGDTPVMHSRQPPSRVSKCPSSCSAINRTGLL